MTMAFDCKKAYREFYLPPRMPGIVTVPAMHFLAVRGQGDPNEEGGAYDGMAHQVRIGKRKFRGWQICAANGNTQNQTVLLSRGVTIAPARI